MTKKRVQGKNVMCHIDLQTRIISVDPQNFQIEILRLLDIYNIRVCFKNCDAVRCETKITKNLVACATNSSDTSKIEK